MIWPRDILSTRELTSTEARRQLMRYMMLYGFEIITLNLAKWRGDEVLLEGKRTLSGFFEDPIIHACDILTKACSQTSACTNTIYHKDEWLFGQPSCRANVTHVVEGHNIAEPSTQCNQRTTILYRCSYEDDDDRRMWDPRKRSLSYAWSYYTTAFCCTRHSSLTQESRELGCACSRT